MASILPLPALQKVNWETNGVGKDVLLFIAVDWCSCNSAVTEANP